MSGTITPGDDKASVLTPADWERRVALPPVLSAALGGKSDLRVRRWIGTPPQVEQPRLDHHYVALHLGGAKRVTRRGEGPEQSREVEAGQVTVVPAGRAFTWRTEGPIDYAHLYLPPRKTTRVIEEVFDRDGARIDLRDKIGADDPLMHALFAALLAEAGRSDAGALYLDMLGETIAVALVRNHSTLGPGSSVRRYTLAPARLKRVEDFIEAKLHEEVTLDALSSEAGLSRFHFARSFTRGTGLAPHAYLRSRRIARAKMLLVETDKPVEDIATECGFASVDYFSSRFRRDVGVNPKRYRARNQ